MTMRPPPDIRYDVASAICLGQRDLQEDAIIADFPLGSELGFAVLADGMGGHTAGDIASKIVVTEVFSELKLQSGDAALFARKISDILLDAALAANECVKGHVAANPETNGMGATLVAPVFVRDQLSWISIGDSPLYLYRDGALRQLNEDHSMAPQIDLMVRTGMIEEEAGRDHPDRNCLTSVLIGDEIPRIDCPKSPIDLNDGDILIVASDGLQFLSNQQIESVLATGQGKNSQEISDLLLQELKTLGDPEQDNISFSVIRIVHVNQASKAVQAPVEPEPLTQVAFSSGRANGKIAAARRFALRPLLMVRTASDASDGTA